MSSLAVKGRRGKFRSKYKLIRVGRQAAREEQDLGVDIVLQKAAILYVLDVFFASLYERSYLATNKFTWLAD